MKWSFDWNTVLSGFAVLIAIIGTLWRERREDKVFNKNEVQLQLEDRSSINQLKKDMERVERIAAEAAAEVEDHKLECARQWGENNSTLKYIKELVEKQDRALENLQSQMRLLAVGAASKKFTIEEEK